MTLAHSFEPKTHHPTGMVVDCQEVKGSEERTQMTWGELEDPERTRRSFLRREKNLSLEKGWLRMRRDRWGLGLPQARDDESFCADSERRVAGGLGLAQAFDDDVVCSRGTSFCAEGGLPGHNF